MRRCLEGVEISALKVMPFDGRSLDGMLPKSGGLVMSAAASVKTASADSPIHEVLAERWSPYAFRDKPVVAG
jgi:hypothetical protein